MDSIPYTIWIAETGEIERTGSTTVIETLFLSEGQELYEGQEMDRNTHVFDRQTKLPVLRTAEKPIPIDIEYLTVLINKERDRRCASGFEFEGKIFQSRPEDVVRIDSLYNLALVAYLNGAMQRDLRWNDPDADFVWIAADNSSVPMDCFAMLRFGKEKTMFQNRMVLKARQLKDKALAGENVNYEDDAAWI